MTQEEMELWQDEVWNHYDTINLGCINANQSVGEIWTKKGVGSILYTFSADWDTLMEPIKVEVFVGG